MCGRFVLMTPRDRLAEKFGAPDNCNEEPRYNIAPTQNVRIIRINPDTRVREICLVRWGLIPSWAKDASIGNRLINARCESLPEKPAFRNSFKFRRCLVPCDGFYEWEKIGKTRQPYLFRMADGGIFALAGLWDRRRGPDGTTESCTIITTESNDKINRLHDRMPAIIEPRDYDAWLDPGMVNPAVMMKLLNPFPSELMIGIPVSPRVNKAD